MSRCICAPISRIFTGYTEPGMNRRSFILRSGLLAAAGISLPGLKLIPRREMPLRTPEDFLPDKLIQEALARGAEYAEARFIRSRRQTLQVQNQRASSIVEGESAGWSLRLFLGGSSGFAAADDLSEQNLGAFVEETIALARARRGESSFVPPRSEMKLTWTSQVETDPFPLPLTDKIDFLRMLNKTAMDQAGIEFAVSNLFLERREMLLVSSAGARVELTHLFTYPNFAVTAVDKKKGLMESRPSFLAPQAIGYEITRLHPFREEVLQAAQEAREKLAAPVVETGPYALVIDPSHLAPLLDETIGFHLDPDNLLGLDENNPRERMYAIDDVGKFSIGSSALSLLADPALAGGLASAPADDEGRSASGTLLVDRGRVVALAGDSTIVSRLPAGGLFPAAYGGGWENPVISRLPDLRLLPDPNGKSAADMIAGVERGLLLKGKGGIVHNFDRQAFMAYPALAWRIQDGVRTGMVRAVAYQSRLVDFWKGCVAVGTGAETALWGTMLSEKGIPARRLPHSLSCPPAQFAPVTVFPSGK